VDTSKQFKALANRHRLAIFEYLRHQEAVAADAPDGSCANNVGAVAEQFGLALSTVSHHLRVLYEAGLIQCEQRGQYVYCVINWETVRQMRQFLNPREDIQVDSESSS
jgi:ArsR family transcriptional regulator